MTTGTQQARLESLVNAVAAEWQMGGLDPSTIYGELAIEVAKRAVAAERERWSALVQANADACTPGSMLQVCLASNAAAIRQDPDASPPSPPPAPMPASAATTPQG
jgi:hypothetical protein